MQKQKEYLTNLRFLHSLTLKDDAILKAKKAVEYCRDVLECVKENPAMMKHYKDECVIILRDVKKELTKVMQ